VLALEKGHYLWQFGQFAWTHMILLVVFIPTSFFVSNIFDGLIWFLLPCALVIINDISAYLTGRSLHLEAVSCLKLQFDLPAVNHIRTHRTGAASGVLHENSR
jgi:CDP-diglyceride synthetase